MSMCLVFLKIVNGRFPQWYEWPRSKLGFKGFSFFFAAAESSKLLFRFKWSYGKTNSINILSGTNLRSESVFSHGEAMDIWNASIGNAFESSYGSEYSTEVFLGGMCPHIIYTPEVKHSPWKMVVGRLLSYWEVKFWGPMLNFGVRHWSHGFLLAVFICFPAMTMDSPVFGLQFH